MNQFVLIASSATGDSEEGDDFFWKLSLFRATILVMLPEKVMISKVKKRSTLLMLSPVMPLAIHGNCRSLLHGSINSILAENFYKYLEF